MKIYTNEEWLRDNFITKNKTKRELALIAGVSEMTIQRYLRKFNINKSKDMVYKSRKSQKHPIQSVIVQCEECGKPIKQSVQYYKKRINEGVSTFYCVDTCVNEAHSKRMTGENNPNFNGKWHGDVSWRETEEGKRLMRRNGLAAIERMKENGTYEDRMRRLHEGHRRFFSTTEGRALRRKLGVLSKIKQGKGGRTSIEIKMADELDKRHVEFIEQYNIDDRYVVDFFLPRHNIIIECDGEYWHTLPEVVSRDKRKNAYINSRGYSLYRFWESEINESVEACVDIVVAEINDKEAIS